MVTSTATFRASSVPLLFLCALPVFAQQPAVAPPDAGVLQALLAEVHQLRISLDKSASIVPRIQLATSRFQLQQERVDKQEKDLQVIRNQIADHSNGKDRMTSALHQAEETARQTQEPVARKQFEEAAANFRNGLEQQTAREQQARIQESEAANQLKIEQAKLSDLEQQLNRLDKILQ